MDLTSRIGLSKPNPDPVTGDVVDIAVLNANADKIDSVISATPCTSSTRPGAPFQGQTIIETDTKKMYVRVGTAWLQVATLDGGNLVVDGSATFGAQITIQRSSTGDHILRTLMPGDTVHRFALQTDGRFNWGPGGNSGWDVNLYRSAADTLRTDDTFQANRFIATATTSSFPPPASTAIPLSNGWVNYDTAVFEAATVFKDATGVVHVTGLVKSGTVTSGTVMGTLPVGFRPGKQELFTVVTNGTPPIARVDVKPDGTISANTGVSAGYTSFAGISFKQVN